ncbi:hypothetical protein E2C01_024596 [Portunus trituberculatus]|uniref:Uncharacterized protein n=1 Tax=Portunus trituberculatus TaxID=210409 RepID=A0A5B7EAQ6_PORTR|nr:hypothetical protein [Portunus trituberculatus]
MQANPQYLLNYLKYVKNRLFWCISVYFAPKLRNADKTLHVLKLLNYVFLLCFMKKNYLDQNFVYSIHLNC